jgi:hydrogenase/urease accessory protein HupE
MSVLSRISYPVSRIPYLASQTAFFAIFCLAPLVSFAHEVRPAYLELREGQSSEFTVLWKTPMRGNLRLALEPKFSGQMEPLTPVTTHESEGAAVQRWRVQAVDPLRGQSVQIVGLEGTMTDALVRVEYTDGSMWVKRLTPAEPSAQIPVELSGWNVAAEYLTLGVEHILFGLDHLLFVLALLLISPGMWPLVKTVSAYTLAHSLTLGLATLGFVHVPQAPVEAVIALSIVFVASEIVRMHGTIPRSSSYSQREVSGDFVPSKQKQIPLNPPFAKGKVESGSEMPLTARAPWIVAFTFGLLHGFGFAGALSEIGLPQGHIPLALLFFNLGVEAGQLLFIASVLALLWLVSEALSTMRDSEYEIWEKNLASRIAIFESRFALVPAYAIGSVAMFWVFQRLSGF